MKGGAEEHLFVAVGFAPKLHVFSPQMARAVVGHVGALHFASKIWFMIS
jgi:hypothetical protein